MISYTSNDKQGNTALPNQRVSLRTKQTLAWTKDMADYVVQLAISCNDKSITRNFLNMANGEVPKDMYEYVLKTHGISKDDIKKEQLISDLREIDLLQPIKDKYLGEFTSSYNNYQVYTDDPDTVFLRNKSFGDKVLKVMEQQLINELNKQNVDTGKESKPVPDIEKMLEEYVNDWNDERASAAQLRLNLLNNLIDAKLKYNQIYYYWWACEEAYSYRQIHKKDVLFEAVSPMEYYRVDSGNTFVEDDDYGVRIFTRSIYTILDMYSEYLTKEDIDFLNSITNSELDVSAKAQLLKSRHIENGMKSSDFIDGMNDSFSNLITNGVYSNPTQIPMVHYVAKTEVKIGYLKYQEVDGSIQEMIVDEDYVLDTENGDIEIKWDYIQEVYQGEIIGYTGLGKDNSQCVYTKFRPIDTQREKFSNLNVCKLPYNGLSYIHKDSAKKPIPFRINPYLALIRIYYYQMEKAINKWKSILLLAQSLLTDDSNMMMEQRLSKMESSSMLVFNDANINANAVQSMREIATTATYNYVNTLMQLVQNLKLEAWEVANMTPSRMGNQKAYQGKSVTENSLEQASISSNWSLEMFNLFRGKDYLANYDYSKISWSEGKQGTYIDESTNELKTVAVDPMEHMSLNIGINVGNSRLLDEKLRSMKEVAFSASQNGNFDLAVEAILNDNLQSLKHKVLEANKAAREYQQQIEDSKNQATLQAKQMDKEIADSKAQLELQKIDMENSSAENIALINQQTQLMIWEKRLEADKNGNGYISESEQNNNDYMDNYFKLQTLNLKQQELALKRKTEKDRNSNNKTTN